MRLPFFSSNHDKELSSSELYNERSFYKAFEKDLRKCKNEAIIESPFITVRRAGALLPIFSQAKRRGVKILLNTRDPLLHGPPYDGFAIDAIAELERIGVEVIYTGNHHRKLAIFDRAILWEGSLNILSQNDSCEIMRRIDSSTLARKMIKFIGVSKFLN